MKQPKYYLDRDKVVLENTGTDSIYYSYDVDDKPVSLTLNGTEYFYHKDPVGLKNPYRYKGFKDYVT
jgi:hypothetical protein